MRGMPNYVSSPSRDAIDTDVTIYHAMPHGLSDALRKPIVADFVVDVTSVIDRKAVALECHQSQKDWLGRTQGMGSYVDTMKELNAEAGRQTGSSPYAEGWQRHLHLGYSRNEQTPLETLLADVISVPKNLSS